MAWTHNTTTNTNPLLIRSCVSQIYLLLIMKTKGVIIMLITGPSVDFRFLLPLHLVFSNSSTGQPTSILRWKHPVENYLRHPSTFPPNFPSCHRRLLFLRLFFFLPSLTLSWFASWSFLHIKLPSREMTMLRVPFTDSVVILVPSLQCRFEWVGFFGAGKEGPWSGFVHLNSSFKSQYLNFPSTKNCEWMRLVSSCRLWDFSCLRRLLWCVR